VGAQSIAHVRQNLVNCQGNISAHRRRRKLRFFYSKDLWLESEIKLKLHKNTLKIIAWHEFELAYKKIYILRGKMPIKSLKKIILRKKTEGILLWDITNWFWGKLFFVTWFIVHVLL
jgi:hypothetical protein